MDEERKLSWRSRFRKWCRLPYPELESAILYALERLSVAGQQGRQYQDLQRAKKEGWFKQDKKQKFCLIQNDLKKAYRKTFLYKLGWRLKIEWYGPPMAMYIKLTKVTPGTKRRLHLYISYYDVAAFRRVCNGLQPTGRVKLLPYRYDALERLLFDL